LEEKREENEAGSIPATKDISRERGGGRAEKT
jgi:hypothetical protein